MRTHRNYDEILLRGLKEKQLLRLLILYLAVVASGRQGPGRVERVPPEDFS